MMKIRIQIIAIGLSAVGIMMKGQTYVPPTFGADSMNTRLDEISRLYIPPKNVMWISNNSLVKNMNVLLLPRLGIGSHCLDDATYPGSGDNGCRM